MENESSISLGGTTILLALFAQKLDGGRNSVWSLIYSIVRNRHKANKSSQWRLLDVPGIKIVTVFLSRACG